MSSKLSNRIKQSARVLIKGAPTSTGKREVPAITLQEVADAKEFFPQEKFFIFGHARSGTTLLTRLVRVHPKVHCNYQGHFFTRAPLLESLVNDESIGLWLGRRSNRWNRGRDLSPLVLRAASDFIMERDARKAGKGQPDCIVGDKSPNSLLNGQAVHQMVKVYPEARLVFIVRDGRDAALSHRFQAFIDNVDSLSTEDLRIRQDFSNDPEPFLAGQRSIFTEKGLRNSSAGWVSNVTETHLAAQELLGDRYFHLRYEDMLDNPHKAMHGLWTFLDVVPDTPGVNPELDAELNQNPDADWQRQKAGDIASALEKGKAGSWRNLFTQKDLRIFQDFAGDTLTEWGYEVIDNRV